MIRIDSVAGRSMCVPPVLLTGSAPRCDPLAIEGSKHTPWLRLPRGMLRTLTSVAFSVRPVSSVTLGQ
eukprot:3693181-Heterocapsa_arctica.AAC.1